MDREHNRYSKLIENIFFKRYKKGLIEVRFVREDISSAAATLKIRLPKNIGDLVYSFRYRASLPNSILKTAPKGLEWVIRPVGQAKYMFSLASSSRIVPSPVYAETKIPDSTPGIISKYALDDEQGLLARLRYNRLIDTFTGITCYSLQNHLRTTVPSMGQIETDELYVGLDKKGVPYILPIQAKAGSDKLGIIQIEQDVAMCRLKFPGLLCLPIAAQFIDKTLIALFSFEINSTSIAVNAEKHYRLVDPAEITDEELIQYKNRIE